MASPDFDRTCTRLGQVPTDSVGLSAGSVGIGWVWSKSVGIRRKRGETVTPLMRASVLGSRFFTRLKVDQACGIDLNLLPFFLSAHHRKKKCASPLPAFLCVLSWEPQWLLKIATRVYIIAVPPFLIKVCMSPTRHQTGHLIDHLSGNYYDQIDAALIAAGQSQDSNHVHNSLFFCINDNNTNGNIKFVEFCEKGCQDGGDKNSDFCNNFQWVLHWLTLHIRSPNCRCLGTGLLPWHDHATTMRDRARPCMPMHDHTVQPCFCRVARVECRVSAMQLQ